LDVIVLKQIKQKEGSVAKGGENVEKFDYAEYA
jgi:hypothetical protein